MNEYVLIRATGDSVRDAGNVMLERGLALSVEVVETYHVHIKNGKAKTGFNSNAVIMLVDRERLDEAMGALKAAAPAVCAYALPVLAATGVS